MGFVDVDVAELDAAATRAGVQEAVRHSRIDEVIEGTVLHAFHELRTEHDFTADLRAVELGSPRACSRR